MEGIFIFERCSLRGRAARGGVFVLRELVGGGARGVGVGRGRGFAALL